MALVKSSVPVSRKEQGLERGVALSDDGMEQAGMGVGVGDLRLNGSLDIVKTHFAADTPALYANNGKGDFRVAGGLIRGGIETGLKEHTSSIG